MRYAGGKNLRQTLSRIICQIPPHGCYIELFCGSAAVLRHKRPGSCSVAVDRDPGAIAALAGRVPAGTRLECCDAIEWLQRFDGQSPGRSPGAFIYLDPPYLETSCSSRLRYQHVLTPAQHAELLDILVHLPCPVAISGYWSELYGQRLSGWRSIHWPEITRGGYARDQWLWMNYPEPAELHDYRFLGDNYRERENLARQRRRWVERLQRMPRLKRFALLLALREATAEAAVLPGPAALPLPAGGRRKARVGAR